MFLPMMIFLFFSMTIASQNNRALITNVWTKEEIACGREAMLYHHTNQTPDKAFKPIQQQIFQFLNSDQGQYALFELHAIKHPNKVFLGKKSSILTHQVHQNVPTMSILSPPRALLPTTCFALNKILNSQLINTKEQLSQPNSILKNCKQPREGGARKIPTKVVCHYNLVEYEDEVNDVYYTARGEPDTFILNGIHPETPRTQDQFTQIINMIEYDITDYTIHSNLINDRSVIRSHGKPNVNAISKRLFQVLNSDSEENHTNSNAVFNGHLPSVADQMRRVEVMKTRSRFEKNHGVTLDQHNISHDQNITPQSLKRFLPNTN